MNYSMISEFARIRKAIEDNTSGAEVDLLLEYRRLIYQTFSEGKISMANKAMDDLATASVRIFGNERVARLLGPLYFELFEASVSSVTSIGYSIKHSFASDLIGYGVYNLIDHGSLWVKPERFQIGKLINKAYTSCITPEPALKLCEEALSYAETTGASTFIEPILTAYRDLPQEPSSAAFAEWVTKNTARLIAQVGKLPGGYIGSGLQAHFESTHPELAQHLYFRGSDIDAKKLISGFRAFGIGPDKTFSEHIASKSVDQKTLREFLKYSLAIGDIFPEHIKSTSPWLVLATVESIKRLGELGIPLRPKEECAALFDKLSVYLKPGESMEKLRARNILPYVEQSELLKSKIFTNELAI